VRMLALWRSPAAPQCPQTQGCGIPPPPARSAQDGAGGVIRAAFVKTRILPLNIRRVLTSLGHDLKSDENAARTGIARWIAGGFMTFDRCIARHRQHFACGPEVRAAGGGVYPAGRWAHPAFQPGSEGGRER
jgi:hypothetical protein